MKKFMFLLFIFLAFAYRAKSQGLENFDNSNATSSYSDGNFVGENGITWYYVQSRNANGDANGSGINLPALMLRRSSSNSKVYCESIPGGIGNFSVKLYKGFTGSGNRQVELFINDVSYGTSTPFDDYNEHIFSVNNINVSGNIVIRIDDITSKQVIVDDITWTGYSSGAPDNPTNFAATTANTDEIDLSWTQNANSDDVMVAWSSDGTFGTPVDGTTYTAGNSITGGGTVIYNGNATTFNHTGLTADTRYYYKAWSHDATPDYSSGVTDDTTTLATEPTADPTAFSASTVSASEIDLSWTDASPAADYYLIKGSSVGYGDITDPVDGTSETDGGLVLNVASGVGSAQFTGLTPNTTYYFQIYPYNGDNGSVNYKTDSPEQASATTDTHVEPNAWINELHYDNTSTDVGEFVEIIIENASSYTLSDFQVNLYNGSNGASYNSKTVDNFIVGTTDGNYTFYYWEPSSIQNGPDGLTLSYQSILITGQFLSYEGDFTATDGPANGETSTNIGVAEGVGTQVGESLQLKGGGDVYSLFSWQDPAPETKGNLNNKQYLGNYTTWTGNTDNDWATSTNWNNGVPDASQNVIVPQGLTNYPTLSASGNCDDIILESNTNGNASILGNSYLTVSGTTKVERYFQGYDDGALNGWHEIGSPVNNMSISGSDFDPTGTSDDLYQWNESTDTWENYRQGHFSNFTNGRGYLCAFQSSGTKDFVGTLNTAGVTWTDLSYDVNHWHLLGNPFPSALTWDNPTADWAMSSIGGTAKIWDEAAGNYADISSSSSIIIPSTNGFFVEVTSATNSITIPASARVHNSANNYKSSNANEMDETLVLKVTNDENTYYDVSRIGFNPDATEAWDIAFDSHKLFGESTAPQLWTISNEDIFSQNYLPYVYEPYQVPLHFKAGVNTTYHITAQGLDSFYDNSDIFLEDLFTGKIINLNDQQVYNFTATTDDDEARFVLHFNSITAVGETPADQNASVYSYNKRVYIRFNQLPKSGYEVEAFNTMGQQVYAGQMEPNTLNSFRLDEKTGIYIVRVKTNEGMMVQKVMIK